MKIFPILHQSYREKPWEVARDAGQCALIVGLPWEMLAPHEKQAQKNHGQSLERLAQRGGLSLCEALAVLEDRDWRKMPDGDANATLGRMIVAFGGGAFV